MASLEFRPLRREDLGTMAAWLRHEHVQRWWRDPSAPEQVAETYLPTIDGESTTDVYVVVHDGVDIGMIQSYLARDDPDWVVVLDGTGLRFPNAAGIDYFIGEPELTGQGIGTAVIAAFSRLVFAGHRDVDCIVVTPQAANVASCRVLEKNGYVREWLGHLVSDDPGDQGLAALYVRRREARGTAA